MTAGREETSAAERSGPAGSCCAAVVAGGQNRRMGCNKALLEVGGRTLLERILIPLRGLVEEVFLVANDAEPYRKFGLSVFGDILPGRGSLGGIYTALVRSPHPWVLCLACDMPFFQRELAAHLVAAAVGDVEAVIPRLAQGSEPLFAVYSTALVPRLAQALEGGERKIMRALEGAALRLVEEEELRRYDPRLQAFFNVNTPEDLARARLLAGSKNEHAT